MARDYYCPFPLDLPNLSSIRRLRRSKGPGAVLLYYELRIACFQAYQYGQHVEVTDVFDSCADWDMDEAQAEDALKTMADYRLIDADALACGFIGIADVADRAEYIDKKAAAGRKSGESRRAKSSKKND